MLVSADVKSLEVVVCAYLSEDRILRAEVVEGIDFHELNRQRFRLPNRVTAKRFKFKLIYGASAYGYANDGDFTDVGYSQDQWQKVIDEYYDKYSGVKRWHYDLVQRATTNGIFRSPSGRCYSYPSADVAKRLWFWRPKILNYPVQGLGADLVMLARISLWKRMCQNLEFKRILPISSVHDSIVLDVPEDLVYNIAVVLRSCVRDVPSNFDRCFGVKFDLPLDAEVKVGRNLNHMEVLKV